MSYPNPTVPSTVPTDIGTAVQQTHAAASSLPVTGGEIVVLLLIAFAMLVVGSYLIAVKRIDHGIDNK